MADVRTFLVVDDSEDNQFLARRVLLKAFPDAQVIAAPSAEIALAAAERMKFDGVVTDHHLGSDDGLEFMRALRERGVECPVVVVTANSNPRLIARAYAAGAAKVFAGSDWDFVWFFQADAAKRGR